jgi:hypothetical protein
MSYEITFRFPWTRVDRHKVDRAVRSTLRDYSGAAIEASDDAVQEGALELDYTLSFPEELVRRHRDEFDDPLPASEDTRFYGTFIVHADDEFGAYLMLEGDKNGHIWGLMSEISAAIAEKLGGRLEQDEEDEQAPEEDGEDEDSLIADREDQYLEDECLTTWEILERHARRAYPLDGDGEGWFATTVSWTDTPRTHQVRVTHFDRNQGEPWVVLRSAVCKREQLSPEEALRRNDELPVATLALSGDVYELVYSFPLEALTSSRFDMLLDQIAAEADDLEETFSGGDQF